MMHSCSRDGKVAQHIDAFKLLGDTRLSAALQDEHWSEEAIVDRVMRDMETAMDTCSMASVREKMRVVKPYNGMPNKSFQDVRPSLFVQLVCC